MGACIYLPIVINDERHHNIRSVDFSPSGKFKASIVATGRKFRMRCEDEVKLLKNTDSLRRREKTGQLSKIDTIVSKKTASSMGESSVQTNLRDILWRRTKGGCRFEGYSGSLHNKTFQCGADPKGFTVLPNNGQIFANENSFVDRAIKERGLEDSNIFRSSSSDSDSVSARKSKFNTFVSEPKTVSRRVLSVEKKTDVFAITYQSTHSDEISCSMIVLRQHLDSTYIDFFLPKLDFSCSCEECRQGLHGMYYDQLLVSDLLRPWQAKFLSFMGIATIQQLCQQAKQNSRSLCKAMVRWRKQNEMEQMSRNSCSMALHIWSRAAHVFYRKLRAEIQVSRAINQYLILDDGSNSSVSTLSN